jgi:hypothetical protein
VAENSSYRISIDGAWSLEDFYEMPHVFSQVYSFHCAFLLAVEARDPERLAHAFASYPWRGGYSAVNFYQVLISQIPHRLRPKVKSVHYASPGWFELGLWVAAAASVGKVVKSFVDSAGRVNKLYSDIHKGLHERKLLRIEEERRHLQLAKEELDFVEESSQQLSRALGFENLAALNTLTGNPLATTKILLSYYRRVRTLADYAKKGKAAFPDEEPPLRIDD